MLETKSPKIQKSQQTDTRYPTQLHAMQCSRSSQNDRKQPEEKAKSQNTKDTSQCIHLPTLIYTISPSYALSTVLLPIPGSIVSCDRLPT